MEDLRERVSRLIADQFHVGLERITESATIDVISLRQALIVWKW
jgi:hypothetical protein